MSGQFEMTPEMIAAGVAVLQDSGRLSFEDAELDRILVESIYRAMRVEEFVICPVCEDERG